MTIDVPDRITSRASETDVTAALVHRLGVIRQFGSDRVHGLETEIPPGTFVAVLRRGACGTSAVPRLIGELDGPTRGRPPVDDAAPDSRRSLWLVSPLLPRSERLIAEPSVTG